MGGFPSLFYIQSTLNYFRWGIILVKTFLGITKNLSYEELYNNVSTELAIFQTLAILEIVHAGIGFVRSPVATTATQVFSRVVVVWTILYKVPTVSEIYICFFSKFPFLSLVQVSGY